MEAPRGTPRGAGGAPTVLDSREAISAYCRAIAGSTIRSIVIPSTNQPKLSTPPPASIPLQQAVPYVDVPECASTVLVDGATRAVLFELRRQRAWPGVLLVLSAHLPEVHEAVMRSVRRVGNQVNVTSSVETHGTVVRVACAPDAVATPLSLTCAGLTQVACNLGATCDEQVTGELSVGFGPIRCEATPGLTVAPEAAPALAACVSTFIEEPITVEELSIDEQSVLPQLRGNVDVRFPRDGDIELVVLTTIDGFPTGPSERFEREKLVRFCRTWAPPRCVGLDPDLIRLALWRAAPCDWRLLGVCPLSMTPVAVPEAVGVCDVETEPLEEFVKALEPVCVDSDEPELVIPALVEAESVVPGDVLDALARVYGPREVDIIAGDLDRSIAAYVEDVCMLRATNHEISGHVCPPLDAPPPDPNAPDEAWHFFRGSCLRGHWRHAHVDVHPSVDTRHTLDPLECLEALVEAPQLEHQWNRICGARSMVRQVPTVALDQGLAYVIRGVLGYYGFRDGQRFGNDYAGDINRTLSWYEWNLQGRHLAPGCRRGARGPRLPTAVVHPDVGPALCSVRGRMCTGDCMYCPWGNEVLPEDMADLNPETPQDIRLFAPRRATTVYCYTRRARDGEELDSFDFGPYDEALLIRANIARWEAGWGPMPIGFLESTSEDQRNRARVLYIVSDQVVDHVLQQAAVSWGYAHMPSIGLVLHRVLEVPGCVTNATVRIFGEHEEVEQTD